MLRDLDEHRVAQLAEQRIAEAQGAVGEKQGDRQEQELLRLAQGVHDLLEHQRHRDVRDLGERQEAERQQHPPLELPEIGQERADSLPVVTFGRRLAVVLQAHGEKEISQD